MAGGYGSRTTTRTRTILRHRTPVGAIKAVDVAVVGAELAGFYETEPEAFVEAVGTGVAGEGVEEDGGDFRRGEAAGDGELHHAGAVAATEVFFFTDPDVEGAEIGRGIAPVVRVFTGGIDDLDEADGTTIIFGDELLAPVGLAGEFGFPVPIVVGIGVDDVGLFIPAAEQGEIGKGGGAEVHGRKFNYEG